MLGLFLASLALSAAVVVTSLLPGEHESPATRPTGSLRFWVLALLGFGACGAPLALLAVQPAVAVAVSAATGLALGRLLWPLFEDASAELGLESLSGVEARVLVGIGPADGKIVVHTLAARVELPARAFDGARIAAGARVLVAGVEGGVARVVGLGPG